MCEKGHECTGTYTLSGYFIFPSTLSHLPKEIVDCCLTPGKMTGMQNLLYFVVLWYKEVVYWSDAQNTIFVEHT